MVVVALLRQADLRLEPEHLLPILAQLAIHQVLAGADLVQRGERHAAAEDLVERRRSEAEPPPPLVRAERTSRAGPGGS